MGLNLGTRTGRAVVVIGAAGALTITGAVAYAAGAAPNTTIYACVAKSGGAVRIVGRTVKCKRSEKRIDWNRQGRVGPRGPAGLSAPQLITAEITITDGNPHGKDLSCPAGKMAIAGGFSEGVHTWDYRAQPTPDNRGYKFMVWPNSANPMAVRMYVKCAKVG